MSRNRLQLAPSIRRHYWGSPRTRFRAVGMMTNHYR